MKTSILTRQNIIRSFLRALFAIALIVFFKWVFAKFFDIHFFTSNNITYYIIFFLIFFAANLISNGKDISWKDLSKNQKNK